MNKTNVVTRAVLGFKMFVFFDFPVLLQFNNGKSPSYISSTVVALNVVQSTRKDITPNSNHRLSRLLNEFYSTVNQSCFGRSLQILPVTLHECCMHVLMEQFHLTPSRNVMQIMRAHKKSTIINHQPNNFTPSTSSIECSSLAVDQTS